MPRIGKPKPKEPGHPRFKPGTRVKVSLPGPLDGKRGAVVKCLSWWNIRVRLDGERKTHLVATAVLRAA
jgi:hypothetical protein